MSRSKKPRKPYRPKEIYADPVSWAIAGSTLFPVETVAELRAPIVAAFDLLRQGRAKRDDWNLIAQGLNIGEALAGMAIGPNLLPVIREAQNALRAVALRMAGGRASTCYSTELHAISEGLQMYGAQLKVCTQAEFSRATKAVKAKILSGGADDIGRIFERMAAVPAAA